MRKKCILCQVNHFGVYRESADNFSMCAFASDLTLVRGFIGRNRDWYLQAMYKDACDSGIAIRSERTDRVERFVLTNNDEKSMTFAPVNPECPVTRVNIWND